MAVLPLHGPLLFLYILLMTIATMVKAKAVSPDSDALLRIKKSLNNPEPLDSWESGTDPCDSVIRWVGLVCSGDLVINVNLRSMNLSGDIDLSALAQLQSLRILGLENNSFSGPLPEFNRLGALKALYLSTNRYSGEIRADYFTKMTSLKKIWFDGNDFSGQIPSSIAQLPYLKELHLERNRFSGSIPPIGQESLESLNLSNNNLSGEIPLSLARFDAASFEENPGLCGAKFGKMCEKPTQSRKPTENLTGDHRHSLRVAYVLMGVCAFVFTLTIAGIYVLVKKRKEKSEMEFMESSSSDGEIGLTVSSISKPSNIPGQNSFGSGQQGLINKKKPAMDLMVLNHEKGVFGLADLMKAPAEVLGNGVLGSSYKATMSNGTVVVVKRLKELNKVDKDGFESEMVRIGRLRHPNILTPLACHYRKEEKLLVYEYVPNGTLLHLLHGDQEKSHVELKWPSRYKIIRGIARGMGYVHTELSFLDLPHGNLKSSNVLLGPDHEPLVVDFGLSGMIDTSHVANSLSAFKAPEAARGGRGHASPKCDVFCLGIVILEILTRKYPCQYLNKGQGGTDMVQWIRSAMLERREADLVDPTMVGSSARSQVDMEKLLHIAAACMEDDPKNRLEMREAVRGIENVRVEGSVETLPSFGDGGYADAASTISVSDAASFKSWGGDSIAAHHVS